MKLFTRKEKRNPVLFGLYNKYIEQGMKPQRAADRAREEYARQQKEEQINNLSIQQRNYA